MYKNLTPGAIGIAAGLRETLRLASLGGFEGMTLPVLEAHDLAEKKGPAYMKALYDSFGLRAGDWMISIPCSGDEKTFAKGLEFLREYADLARQVGAVRATVWIPSWSDERPFRENFDWHVGRLRKVAEVLKENGCRFGLEFLGPKTLLTGHKYEFIHTLDGMLELCRAIGTGNVGLLLDSFHWYTSGGTLKDLEKLRNEDIVSVHVNDAEAVPLEQQVDKKRPLPGETGVIDLAGFLDTLRKIAYDGPVAPEPFGGKIAGLMPEPAVILTAGYLSKLWGKQPIR